MMRINSVFVGFFCLALATEAFSQTPAPVCQVEVARLDALDTKYKPKYDDMQRRGDEMGNDAPKGSVNFDFKVDMKEQKWRFHLPSVTMVRNQIKLGLPQTTMKTQRWVIPEVVMGMERRKTGQIPEFKCKKDNWGIPYDCRTTWTDTYADFPTTTVRNKEVKLDIPQFTWKDTSLSWDIPKITWQENTWVVKIPEFTLVNVTAKKGTELKAKADGLSKDAAALNADRMAETRSASTGMYACLRKDMALQQSSAEKQMDDGIASLRSTIASIKAQGADPTKVPGGDGVVVNLENTLIDLIKKREEASAMFAEALDQMNRSEQDSLKSLGA